MNDRHGLTKENLLRTIPAVLQQDQRMVGLTSAVADILVDRMDEINQLLIYQRIDELPEELLDILAYDFKVDWWDDGYTVEEKRQLLKDSWYVHRHKGTKAAVERAISAIYPKTTVQEWFEYGGDPYTFQLRIDVTDQIVSLTKHLRALELVDYYKNVRSHLVQVNYFANLAGLPAAIRMGGAMATIIRMPIPQRPDVFNFETALHYGGLVAPTITQQLPEIPDAYHFESTLHGGGIMTAETRHPVPELTDLSMSHTGRIGGRGSVTTTISVPEIQ